ncbi:MAG: sulfite exporter TauE/SafE family protein [Lachnospiraceae bacterium]
MILLLFFIICFLASVIGAVCGIGGGIIIKPILDAFGIMDVSTISFLSGCTVLSMTTYSVIKSQRSGHSRIEKKIGIPLAVGGALGGLVGKHIFSIVRDLSDDPNRIGAIQALCLVIVTVGTLLYTIFKNKIKTCHFKNTVFCVLIGLSLGFMSAFLGIGGGPINLVVLFFFFSMDIKTAAENSLYIILFSQITSLALTIILGNMPSFSIEILLVMVAGGITGGMAGRFASAKLKDKTVNQLFIGLMVVIIFINMYNVYKFS